MATEVFTIATSPTAGLARLKMSLSKFGVPITILGENEADFWGYCWRWKAFVRAARASTADTVIHCDGYDSLCLEPLADISTKFASLGHPIVFSYEPQKQPEFWLGLNPGLMMANRDALLAVFSEKVFEDLFPDPLFDQNQIQSMWAWSPSAFKVDTQGVLFHTLGSRSPELVVRNNRLENPVTGNAPSFIHGANGSDMSKVEQWVSALN